MWSRTTAANRLPRIGHRARRANAEKYAKRASDPETSRHYCPFRTLADLGRSSTISTTLIGKSSKFGGTSKTSAILFKSASLGVRAPASIIDSVVAIEPTRNASFTSVRPQATRSTWRTSTVLLAMKILWQSGEVLDI